MSRYRRPARKRGVGMTLIITAIIGALALGLGITAVIVFVKNNKKEPEQTKQEKKEEPPAPPAPAPAPPEPAKGDPKKSKDPDPKKPKDSEPKKPKNPDPKKPKEPNPGSAPGPMSKRSTLVLPPDVKAFNVEGSPPKPQPADKPKAGMVLDTPFKAVKRVFPPFDPKTADTYVLVQTAAGVGGKGERLALDSYSASSSMRVPEARIEYDGDGQANPIADLAASATGVYFLAASGGKLHIWSVTDKKKLADGVNPFAEKPEHAKAGLAAAFFAADPKQVITVSTAGAILLFDLPTGKVVSEFVPPDGAPGKVALGKSVAKAEGGGSVGVAVAGVLYQVSATPGLDVERKYDLGGEVAHSLGLAISDTPGRILYTFDTLSDKPGQSQMAIVSLPLGDDAKPIYYRFPAIGVAQGALWASDSVGGVMADSGVLWFNDNDGGKFLPMVMTRPTNTGLYFGDKNYFWYVIPHPKDATKSVLAALAVPFDDFAEYHKRYASGQALRSVQIDANGLAK